MTARADFLKTCDQHPGEPKVYHRLLIPMALALAVGIFAGGTWPGYGLLVAAVACLTAIYIGHALIRKRRVPLAPILLLVLCGYLSLIHI